MKGFYLTAAAEEGTMAGNLPPNPARGSTGWTPGAGQWTPHYSVKPARRQRSWPVIALATVAFLLGATALVVALIRPMKSPSGTSTATSVVPTYTAADADTAHQKLCHAYRLAARAVQIETNGASPERAGIAEVNGAMLLDDVVGAFPAIAPNDRAAAVALARAYNNLAAVASLNDNSRWQPAVDDANAKDAAMKKVCGGS